MARTPWYCRQMNRWIRTSVEAKSVSPGTAAPKGTPSLHAACGDVEIQARIGIPGHTRFGGSRLCLISSTYLRIPAFTSSRLMDESPLGASSDRFCNVFGRHPVRVMGAFSLWLLLLLGVGPAAEAQESAATSETTPPRVYIDCDRCDYNHIRREITLVRYVRDQKQACLLNWFTGRLYI